MHTYYDQGMNGLTSLITHLISSGPSGSTILRPFKPFFSPSFVTRLPSPLLQSSFHPYYRLLTLKEMKKIVLLNFCFLVLGSHSLPLALPSFLLLLVLIPFWSSSFLCSPWPVTPSQYDRHALVTYLKGRGEALLDLKPRRTLPRLTVAATLCLQSSREALMWGWCVGVMWAACGWLWRVR